LNLNQNKAFCFITFNLLRLVFKLIFKDNNPSFKIDLGVLTRYPLYLFLQPALWQKQEKPARITGGDVASIVNTKT
jgi:hypothetical protein